MVIRGKASVVGDHLHEIDAANNRAEVLRRLWQRFEPRPLVITNGWIIRPKGSNEFDLLLTNL